MTDSVKKSRKNLIWLIENNIYTGEGGYTLRIGRLEKYKRSKSFYMFIEAREGLGKMSIAWVMGLVASWLDDHDREFAKRINVDVYNKYNKVEKNNIYLFVEYWKDGYYPYEYKD